MYEETHTAPGDAVTYPAVWIASDGAFGVTDAPLVEAAYVVFQRGFFDGLRLFDASGREWLVEDAVPTAAPGLLDKMLDRRIRVDVRVSRPRPVSVAEVSERLCSCVDRVAEDLMDRVSSLDELKTSFRAATTPPELIARVRMLDQTG